MHNDLILRATSCVNDFKSKCQDCDLLKFIELFMDQYMSKQNIHNQLKVMVAKGDMQHYIPFLTASLDNFKTIFSSRSGHPCLTIRSGNTNTIQSLDLALVRNMHVETIDTPGCPWVRHNMTFNYMGLVDYDMSLFLYR